MIILNKRIMVKKLSGTKDGEDLNCNIHNRLNRLNQSSSYFPCSYFSHSGTLNSPDI
jgi:IS1 family transposase